MGEWIGAHDGLGALMIRAQNVYYMELVFGAVIVTAILAFLVQRLAHIAERIVIPWHLAKPRRT